MKTLLPILLLISLITACSHSSETAQEAASAPTAPVPAPAPQPTSSPTSGNNIDLSMYTLRREFDKPQSTEEEAVVVESTLYSKTENGPVLLTRHVVLPRHLLNQDQQTHGLVCWNCENHLSSYLDRGSTRPDPDTPDSVYFNMIINSLDEAAGNAPRSSILRIHMNCTSGRGTLLTNTLYDRFFGRGQTLTRDIPRNQAIELEQYTVTPQALAAAEACRLQARPLWNDPMADNKLEAAIINKNLQRRQEREQNGTPAAQ